MTARPRAGRGLALLLAALTLTGGSAALVNAPTDGARVQTPDASVDEAEAADDVPASTPEDTDLGEAANETVPDPGSRPDETHAVANGSAPWDEEGDLAAANGSMRNETPEATNRTPENRSASTNASEPVNDTTSEAANASAPVDVEGPRKLTLRGSIRAYDAREASYEGRYYVNATTDEGVDKPGIPEQEIEIVDARTFEVLARATTGPRGTYDATITHEEAGPRPLQARTPPGEGNTTRSEVLDLRVVEPVEAVDLGTQNTCVLTGAGNVDCYGDDSVFYEASAVEIVAHYGHVCFRNETGNVDCRGPGHSSNDLVAREEDTDYEGGDAVALDTGPFEACVATQAGEAVCWGGDFDGFERLAVDGHVVDVAVGNSHRCALTDAGNVICQGDEDRGQLAPYTGGDAVAVAAGADHTCVRTEAGGTECWGETHGQLADREGGVAALDTQVWDTCLLLETDAVTCQGQDEYNETRDYEGVPARDVGASQAHACVLLVTDRVHCWGWNQLGEALDYPYELIPSEIEELGPNSEAEP